MCKTWQVCKTFQFPVRVWVVHALFCWMFLDMCMCALQEVLCNLHVSLLLLVACTNVRQYICITDITNTSTFPSPALLFHAMSATLVIILFLHRVSHGSLSWFFCCNKYATQPQSEKRTTAAKNTACQTYQIRIHHALSNAEREKKGQDEKWHL